MRRNPQQAPRQGILVFGLIASLMLSSCQPLALLVDDPSWPETEEPANRARVCEKPTVRALARDLDSLERHIETYGSVVAKQPDVWGQARLTKYRDEFEQQMAAEVPNFQQTLQGTVAGADQAYLADAFALSAAASSPQATILRPAPPVSAASSTAVTTTTTPSSQSSSQPTVIPVPALPDMSSTFGAFGAISRPGVTLPAPIPFHAAANGLQIEPTLYLEQKAVYLNHLHELRRISEGDDTADSPGYSLNLVRFPISILPGKRTDVGYGAEVTMTLRPYLAEDLLPTTFRNLVVNDIVDQISFPVAAFINRPENAVYLQPISSTEIRQLFGITDHLKVFGPRADCLFAQDFGTLFELRWKPGLESVFRHPEWRWVDDTLNDDSNRQLVDSWKRLAKHVKSALPNQPLQWSMDVLEHNRPLPVAEPTRDSLMESFKGYKNLAALHASANTSISPHLQAHMRALSPVSLVPQTKSRRARMPFPPSETSDIFGYRGFYDVTFAAYQALSSEPFSKPCPDSARVYIHLPDIQGFLLEELAGARNLLEQPCAESLWREYCRPELAGAIRNHRLEQIATFRKTFLSAVQALGGGRSQELTAGANDAIQRTAAQNRSVAVRPNLDSRIQQVRAAFDASPAQNSACDAMSDNLTTVNPVTATLAWAIIVESALLTEQLKEDMKEAASLKGCGPVPPCPGEFFLPHPSHEDCAAFNQYVQCRWPIHVFALDPARWDQNLGSTFSSRREMQLAMSLAFVNGQISANNMLRFARRLDFDYATIDINGTAVGFSHGEETFGWRFYPRFQVPDVQGNMTVIFQDLLCGGPNRDALLKQRRLEPGIRECYAVVIMPSFVPYATLNVSSDWFSLVNPRKKLLGSRVAMRLSNRVKSIENCAPCVADAQLYRDGDLFRLVEKAKQLETRLPLQSTMVQIPYENTLGGFAMFNTGVTDLAPELIGWYGTSSIDPTRATTLFLVGNHFSVHQTTIVAGGQQVATPQLLSRQVVQATIPANPIVVGDGDQKFVDVHIATPYGVTQHLLIPVCYPAKPGDDNGPQGLAYSSPLLALAFNYAGTGIIPGTDPKTNPSTLLIEPGDVDPDAYPTVDVDIKFGGGFGVDDFKAPNIAYDKTLKGYPIPMSILSGALFAGFGPQFGPEASNPPVSINTTTKLTFHGNAGALQRVPSKELTIKWVKTGAGSGAKSGQ